MTKKWMGELLKIAFQCLVSGVAVFLAVSSSLQWLYSHSYELCSGLGPHPAIRAGTPSASAPQGQGVTRVFFLRLVCKYEHWWVTPQSRQALWRSCSLTSALSPSGQLKVARAAASSRGDLPKSGPSGRASITTSKAVTSIRTHSPVRPRSSRWGEFSEGLHGC